MSRWLLSFFPLIPLLPDMVGTSTSLQQSLLTDRPPPTPTPRLAGVPMKQNESSTCTYGATAAPQIGAGDTHGGAIAAAPSPIYEPNIPEPQTREELLKFWTPLSLDDRTAQKLLWISEGATKVSRMSEDVCPYLDRPERYDHSPQVVCKEKMWGRRAYWEVGYTGWVVVGVVYEGAPRKAQGGPCGIGENDASWGLGWAGTCYQAWHNSENIDVEAEETPSLGLYLDQPAGVLSFYAVGRGAEGAPGAARLLHRYKASFSQPLVPAFWVGGKSACWIQNKAE